MKTSKLMIAALAVATVGDLFGALTGDVQNAVCGSLNNSLKGLKNDAKPKTTLKNRLASLTNETMGISPFRDFICPEALKQAAEQLSEETKKTPIKMLAEFKKRYSCPAYICVQYPYDMFLAAKSIDTGFPVVNNVMNIGLTLLQGVFDKIQTDLFMKNPTTIKGCANYYADQLAKIKLTYKGGTYPWWKKVDANGNPTDPVACLPNSLQEKYGLNTPVETPLNQEDQQELDELLG